MRNMLVAALAFGTAMALSLTASAAQFPLDAANSFLDIKLGNIPQIHLTAQSSDVTATEITGGHTVAELASVFQTNSFVVNSAGFTGLPDLTGLKLSLHAGAGNFASGVTYANPVGTGIVSGFGGTQATVGVAILRAGGFDFAINLGVLGAGGTTNLAAVLANVLVLTGAPFNTGIVNITGLSSNLLFVPGLGITGVAFTLNLTTVQLLTATEITTLGVVVENATVTLSGGNNNLASTGGSPSIKMISPFRLSTAGLAGNVAGAVTKTFTFVPEPGTVLLLLTGAAGLAIVGRKRMRK